MPRFLLISGVLICLLVIACGGDDAAATPPPTEAEPTSAATLTPTTSPTESPVPTPISELGRGFPLVRLEAVIQDPTLRWMTAMEPLPDGRWLVAGQEGQVWLVDLEASMVDLFLDIHDKVGSNLEDFEGILGLAVAPDFAESREFYVYFTEASHARNTLARFKARADGETALADSETLILEAEQSTDGHNGGQVAFGPDGYLYLAVGDGSIGDDTLKNGQKLETIQGALLRLDVSGVGPGYAIPADNPFVGQGGAREEVWAYGFRNPWRFSFDSATGDLWLADVGESESEEVDLVVKGGNYGWSVMEGLDCFEGASCDKEGLQSPVIEYHHDEGCSVIGGFVYEGGEIPSLQGAYLYSDFCSGKMWALRARGAKLLASAQIAAAHVVVSSFAQGNDGELYLLDLSASGIIYKLVP